MDAATYFYQLYILDGEGKPVAFIGNAFPISPDGSLLTCRHIVKGIDQTGDRRLAVLDKITGKLLTVEKIELPESDDIDIALLPCVLQRAEPRFFPILIPSKATIGINIYSFGFFAFGDNSQIEQGYFGGKVVNVLSHLNTKKLRFVLLPFPILEGMSGSPILTYHNGVKLVGLAFGNRSSRILASEVLEYKDDELQLRETVNRIVEFGLALHAEEIVQFLDSKEVTGFIVADDRIKMPGLE